MFPGFAQVQFLLPHLRKLAETVLRRMSSIFVIFLSQTHEHSGIQLARIFHKLNMHETAPPLFWGGRGRAG